MTTLLSRRPWRQISPISLYWRRRRRMTAFTAAPLRIVELRTSPVTRLSVYQHFHHASHSRQVFSPTHSSMSVSTTHVAAPHPGVTERILVKRLLEARPLDATNSAPAPASQAVRPTVVRPVSSRSHMPAAPRATGDGRSLPSSRTQLHRIRSVETQQVTTNRTRHEMTRVAQTTQVRDTRWKGLDVVRLEWRKASHSPPRHEDSGAAVARGGASAAPARTSVDSVASTPVPAIHAPRREAAQPVLAMDRSTLDRLTDNVMQRIERRVRIERERRGL